MVEQNQREDIVYDIYTVTANMNRFSYTGKVMIN